MAKYKTIKEMAKEIAEEAMDNIYIDGKTLRDWIEYIKKYYEEDQKKIEWGKGLPKENGRYVCITKSGEVETYEYSGTYKMFNTSDDDDYKSAVNTCINEHILCWVAKEEFLKSQGFKRKEIEKWRG